MSTERVSLASFGRFAIISSACCTISLGGTLLLGSLASKYIPSPFSMGVSVLATWGFLLFVLRCAEGFATRAFSEDFAVEGCLMLYAVGYLVCWAMVPTYPILLYVGFMYTSLFRARFPILKANEEDRKKFIDWLDSVLVRPEWRKAPSPQSPPTETTEKDVKSDSAAA